MCNDFGNKVNYRDYVEDLDALALTLVSPTAERAPNFEPRDEIWPTDLAPVIRPAEGGVELLQCRWGLAPSNPKARAIINMRSEGRNFTAGRCLVPASHYYEFTGAKSPKTRWRFTVVGQDWFCFAGLIGRGETKDGPCEAFTLLTCAPGPDIAPHHDRQPVILARADWAAWLDPSKAAGPLLNPSPAGSVTVAHAPRAGTLL
jgi:putative SOS response-associated peptidase YedK